MPVCAAVGCTRRPVASLPGGWFVGGPKGDRVGWGGVCVCVGGGGYYYSEWSRGVVRLNPPNPPPPPGYGPDTQDWLWSAAWPQV